MVEHRIPVDGGYLYAEEVGAGVAVLLLHAGVTDRRVWDPLVPALADRHQVIRVDSRGYGRSPRPGKPFSLVADAVAVLEALGVERAHVVGLSQGAATALDTALAHPGRVATLTLVAPGLSGYDWPRLPGYEERMAAYERGDLQGVADGLVRLWAPLSIGPDGRPVDDLAVTMIRDALDFLLEDELEADEPSAVPRLGEVAVPTLVVLGADDLGVITDIGDLLAAEIPGARRVMLAGADHILPLRAPDELASLLADHLR
jgi:pimeloyl-ACP methyl ester carboxylesterase